MGKIIWSPTAYKDIDLIAEYIARDSIDRAALFVTKLMSQADKLMEYPKAGRMIPGISSTSGWRTTEPRQIWVLLSEVFSSIFGS